jgi:predicted nucleic acid-binding protein
MYLVDTDVFSELRRSRRNRNVVAWLGEVNAADLFLSVVTIGEIELGISRQQHLNSRKTGAQHDGPATSPRRSSINWLPVAQTFSKEVLSLPQCYSPTSAALRCFRKQ